MHSKLQVSIKERVLQKKPKKIVFPKGIPYNQKKLTYRTVRVSSLFLPTQNPLVQLELAKKENGTNSNKLNLSRLVPKVGIEPTLQWNTSLSRARLPVPPLGHTNNPQI